MNVTRRYIPITALAVVALVMVFISSCEKIITVDLPKPDQKIVVEGYIFEGDRPYVVLSKNSGYFDPIDSTTLVNTFIYDAVVTVSDGTITDTLTFQPAAESAYGFAYVNQTPTIIGQAGKTYTLTVTAIGQTVTSTTRIIPPVTLDSTKWVEYEDYDSLGYVYVHFTDPGIDERAYRVFSRRLSAKPERNEPLFRPNFYSSNRFYKGQPIEFGISRARQFNDQFNADNPDPDLRSYRLGDTAQVRICTMDLPNYDFYNSLSNSDNTGNPFSAPGNVITNIEGGLGCWGGYGVTQFQIICYPQ
jgi:hypothetical protein